MKETYEIRYEGQVVGTAEKKEKGLYHYFSCRCDTPDAGMYRIHVICQDRREDLGICIPTDGRFAATGYIPSKRLGTGRLSFELVPLDWKPQPAAKESAEEASGIFVPVSETEPFDYLPQLENTVLEIRDGQQGILVMQNSEQEPQQKSNDEMN